MSKLRFVGMDVHGTGSVRLTPVRRGPRSTSIGSGFTCVFEQSALEATLAHYVAEVDHIAEQIEKLEQAIDEAVAQSTPEIRAVIEALQALRGVRNNRFTKP